MKKVILEYIIAIILCWVIVTTLAYAFANPKKTQTEIFLHIPKSFILKDL